MLSKLLPNGSQREDPMTEKLTEVAPSPSPKHMIGDSALPKTSLNIAPPPPPKPPSQPSKK